MLGVLGGKRGGQPGAATGWYFWGGSHGAPAMNPELTAVVTPLELGTVLGGAVDVTCSSFTREGSELVETFELPACGTRVVWGKVTASGLGLLGRHGWEKLCG